MLDAKNPVATSSLSMFKAGRPLQFSDKPGDAEQDQLLLMLIDSAMKIRDFRELERCLKKFPALKSIALKRKILALLAARLQDEANNHKHDKIKSMKRLCWL